MDVLIFLSLLLCLPCQAYSLLCRSGYFFNGQDCTPCPFGSYIENAYHTRSSCTHWTRKPYGSHWVLRARGTATRDQFWTCQEGFTKVYVPKLMSRSRCILKTTTAAAASTTTTTTSPTTTSTTTSTHATTVTRPDFRSTQYVKLFHSSKPPRAVDDHFTPATIVPQTKTGLGMKFSDDESNTSLNQNPNLVSVLYAFAGVLSISLLLLIFVRKYRFKRGREHMRYEDKEMQGTFLQPSYPLQGGNDGMTTVIGNELQVSLNKTEEASNDTRPGLNACESRGMARNIIEHSEVDEVQHSNDEKVKGHKSVKESDDNFTASGMNEYERKEISRHIENSEEDKFQDSNIKKMPLKNQVVDDSGDLTASEKVEHESSRRSSKEIEHSLVGEAQYPSDEKVPLKGHDLVKQSDDHFTVSEKGECKSSIRHRKKIGYYRRKEAHHSSEENVPLKGHDLVEECDDDFTVSGIDEYDRKESSRHIENSEEDEFQDSNNKKIPLKNHDVVDDSGDLTTSEKVERESSRRFRIVVEYPVESADELSSNEERNASILIIKIRQ